MSCLRFPVPLLGCLALFACTYKEDVTFFQDISRDPAYPGAAGLPSDYERLFVYKQDPDCIPYVPRVLNRRTEVRVFRGNGVSPDAVVHYLGGLRRYYDRYGVTMYTRHDAISVPIDHAVVFNDGAISDMMNQQGVPPSCADSSTLSSTCQRAMGAAIFYNVKQFLKQYAEPKQDLINIVLVKRIAALDPGEGSEDSWGIAGLGLSEELVNSRGGSDLGSSLSKILNETDYSPTVFIGVNLIDFIMEEPDIVIAHEFGHAYGLAHVTDETNLMHPEVVDCQQALDSSQLTTIESATVSAGRALLAGAYGPREFLSFAHRGPEIMDIVSKRVAQHARLGGETP